MADAFQKQVCADFRAPPSTSGNCVLFAQWEKCIGIIRFAPCLSMAVYTARKAKKSLRISDAAKLI